MTVKPILSIVTATLGNYSSYWLEQLLNVKGNVEFILVYPPGTTIHQIEDTRVKALISPYKGEVLQRFTGLLNATGEYIIALDDDDFIHPDILKSTLDYFKRFPNSWVFRLRSQNIDYREEAEIKREWSVIPDVTELEVYRKVKGIPLKDPEELYLLEIPIAPIDKSFDIRYALIPFMKRKDMEGVHMENFNNRIWKTAMVQKSLADLSKTMNIIGNLTWLPAWNLDRSLGLFIQAKFFEKDLIIGHWMPAPGQIRFITRPSHLKSLRFYLSADVLLTKRFPQYGYFWNLFFSQLWDTPKIIGRYIKAKFPPS